MDNPLNSFGLEPDDSILDDIDIDDIREDHPELAHRLEEHQKENGYE